MTYMQDDRWSWWASKYGDRWMYRLTGFSSPRFVCYFYFQSFAHIQFGFHVHVGKPNIEIHIPFGFIGIGKP